MMNLLWRMILVHLRAMWRLRSDGRLPLTSVGVLALTTLPTDIDILRHMNNGRYLSLADLGRWDLVVRIGVFAHTQRLGWVPVLVQASPTYRKPLSLGQRFDLQTRMIGTDDRAVVMEQRFVRGGEIYMRLITRTRFVKRSGGVVTIDELQEQFGRLPDHVPGWVHRWADASRLASTKQSVLSDWVRPAGDGHPRPETPDHGAGGSAAELALALQASGVAERLTRAGRGCGRRRRSSGR